MYIQYVGFDTAPSFRIYTFHVINPPSDPREFTVKVQSEAFGPNRLSLQDGPGICYARLALELGGQTPEFQAEASLTIREQDVTDYMEQHYPKKPQA